MLGKRPRSPSIKRTTSMSGITVDVSTNTNDDEIQSTPSNYNNYPASKSLGGLNEQSSVGAILSPRYFRRAAADGGGGGDNSMEPPPFLKACRLCNCQLAPGRDIFMYRGDTAFCSEECREQIMKQDERKEKTNQKAVKTGRTTASKSSENGGETTIIAA